MQPTNNITDNATYPVSRPGQARQGLDVYRANGCAYCHSQQIRQSGTVCDVIVSEASTNQASAVQALLLTKAAATEAEAQYLLAKLPAPQKARQGLSRVDADASLKALRNSGLKADLLIVPIGTDITARNWGIRRSVAEDFLYDSPVMPGSQRIGPDLADVGARRPDPSWHFRHLYAPQTEEKGSVMPPYQYLFERRRIERALSADALLVESGFEIVPKPEARALVAYLLSLRTDAALYNAPFRITIPATPAPTNAPSATATNAPTAPSSTATNEPVPK
jgi:hypothetical protein